ncbi:hypothetical protein PTKIN_Ptkin06aG0077800 [Pterospermum kingtungense]
MVDESVNEEGSDTSYIGSSDIESYEYDGEGNIVCKEENKLYFDPLDVVPYFDLGMIFESPKKFKDVLNKYVISKRFDYKLVLNKNIESELLVKKEDVYF